MPSLKRPAAHFGFWFPLALAAESFHLRVGLHIGARLDFVTGFVERAQVLVFVRAAVDIGVGVIELDILAGH
jgi:hypothetical protein